MRKTIDWLISTPFAHRGLHHGSKCPENSLCSFSRAIDKKFPIELDVHVIAGGDVVVFHDDCLSRMTGVTGDIENQKLEDIQKLKLLDSEECIPTLQEALTLIDGKVPVLVEIKNKKNKKGIEEPIYNILRHYNGAFAIQSFNPCTLLWFKRNAPEIIRGQLSEDFRGEKMNFVKRFVSRTMLLNWLTCPDFIAYEVKSIPPWAAKMLRKRLPLLLWTITTKKEQEKATILADNYIFELENSDDS